MVKKEKTVYVGMAADIIHEGHLNILAEARKLGLVIVGVLTDEAIASYKRIPFTPFKHRIKIVENLKGVDKVIAQETLDYVPNLRKEKPDYLVHGDDWKTAFSDYYLGKAHRDNLSGGCAMAAFSPEHFGSGCSL